MRLDQTPPESLPPYYLDDNVLRPCIRRMRNRSEVRLLVVMNLPVESSSLVTNYPRYHIKKHWMLEKMGNLP